MTNNWKSNKLESRHKLGKELLRVEGIESKDKKVKDASFNIHEGNTWNIWSKRKRRTELLETIYGFRKSVKGEVTLNGKRYHNRRQVNLLKMV